MRIPAESLAEKQQLILVALAPFADQEMQPHFDADSEGERPIHGLGQQPRHVVAWWRNPNEPSDERSDAQLKLLNVLPGSDLHDRSVSLPMSEKIHF
jgi:hypothetical protein